MLTIDDKIDYKEIRGIVNKGSVDSAFIMEKIPVDSNFMFNNIMTSINTNGYLRIVRDDGNPIAIALIEVIKPFLFNRMQVVSLTYLYCMSKGRSAIESIRMIHRAMVEIAVDKRLTVCMSTSGQPTYLTFFKILAQEGWEQSGGTMFLYLDE